MALGNKHNGVADGYPTSTNNTNDMNMSEKPANANAMPPNYNGDEAYDPENPMGRRMSRIGKPVATNDHVPPGSDTESTVSVGAQIELEKENAIKYRTCSWQKVRKKQNCVPSPPIPH